MTNDDLTATYDEFGFLRTYADFEGIPWRGDPAVGRRAIDVGDGQRLSALVWGNANPEIVLLHGGGQNAHTWDSVALALDRPLVALDLPGHGHSDWRSDRDYTPATNAALIARAIRQLTQPPVGVVGMSLGGLTAISLAARHPELVTKLVLVDVTPGVRDRLPSMTTEQRGATALVSGPETFPSFDAMLAATAAVLPGRPAMSLRAGVLHNSKQLDNGRWAWRYDSVGLRPTTPHDYLSLWKDVSKITAAIMLVRGQQSGFVDDDDQAELVSRQPRARVEVVAGAGHSVQSDRATKLATLIKDFLRPSDSPSH